VGASARAAVALPTNLDLAGGGTTIAGVLVAIVTKLGWNHKPITATGDTMTGLARGDAGITWLDPQAVPRTTIAGSGVSVVTCLILGQDAIPAVGRCGAQTGLRRERSVVGNQIYAAATAPSG